MAAGAAAVPARHSLLVSRLMSRAAVVGAVAAAVGFLVLLSRPWWYQSHGATDIPLIGGLQGAEGSPVDGTRTYAEASFQWVSWYYGWPVVIVGIGGLLAWLVLGARSRSTQLLWLSALLLPSAALYLAEPSIVPDQIWAMRRFLPVVVPGLLLASVWVARQLFGRGRVGMVLAGLLTLSVLVFPLPTTYPLFRAADDAGGLSARRTSATRSTAARRSSRRATTCRRSSSCATCLPSVCRNPPPKPWPPRGRGARPRAGRPGDADTRHRSVGGHRTSAVGHLQRDDLGAVPGGSARARHPPAGRRDAGTGRGGRQGGPAHELIAGTGRHRAAISRRAVRFLHHAVAARRRAPALLGRALRAPGATGSGLRTAGEPR